MEYKQKETIMKKSYFMLLATYFALNSAVGSADQSKKSIQSMSNTVHVKIEMGSFFGLFAKNTGELKIEMALQNAYGFEGRPATDADKAEMQRVDDYLKNNPVEMVTFNDMNCTYKFDDIEKKFQKRMHNSTGTIKAKYGVKCEQILKGHEVLLNFTAFKNVEHIRIDVESARAIKKIIDGAQGTAMLR